MPEGVIANIVHLRICKLKDTHYIYAEHSFLFIPYVPWRAYWPFSGNLRCYQVYASTSHFFGAVNKYLDGHIYCSLASSPAECIWNETMAEVNVQIFCFRVFEVVQIRRLNRLMALFVVPFISEQCGRTMTTYCLLNKDVNSCK